MDSNDSKEKLKPLENETLESQFKRFATLRHLHPEKCKQLYDDGEKMIEYSSRGQFSKLRMLLNSLERKDILLYHGVGSGKTNTAINVYNILFNYTPKWNIFLFL